MGWNEQCILALNAAGMFENSGHLTRLKELLDCYSGYPFFTKGLCKCMYLSAWDEEHFAVMLETLNDMALGRDRDTVDMRIQGDLMADINLDEHAIGEARMYQLSSALLENKPFVPAKEDELLSEHYRYLIRRAQEAAKIINGV